MKRFDKKHCDTISEVESEYLIAEKNATLKTNFRSSFFKLILYMMVTQIVIFTAVLLLTILTGNLSDYFNNLKKLPSLTIVILVLEVLAWICSTIGGYLLCFSESDEQYTLGFWLFQTVFVLLALSGIFITFPVTIPLMIEPFIMGQFEILAMLAVLMIPLFVITIFFCIKLCFFAVSLNHLVFGEGSKYRKFPFVMVLTWGVLGFLFTTAFTFFFIQDFLGAGAFICFLPSQVFMVLIPFFMRNISNDLCKIEKSNALKR